MAKKKQSRLEYTLQRVGHMLRWLATSGVITYFLTELSAYVTGFETDARTATLILVVINTIIFAVRSYTEEM